MPSLKEILILIFVLFGCLVIALTNYKQPVNENPQQAEIPKAILSETPYQVKALIWGETKDLKERTDKQPRDDEKNQHISKNSELIQDNPQQVEESNKEIEGPDFSQDSALSLETILAEVGNLASDLKLEFETIRQSENCSTCGQEDNYYLSMEYSSWEEYSLSEQYHLAENYYLANQDSFSEKNPSLRDSSPSICAAILASPGGGTPCSCDYAMGTCYQDTPFGRYYHCLGLCCFACCVICCMIF